MSYRVEIRCDIQRGNSLEKRTCESRRGAQSIVPAGEGQHPDQARRSADRDAKGKGWVYKRRAGRPTAWICNACQED